MCNLLRNYYWYRTVYIFTLNFVSSFFGFQTISFLEQIREDRLRLSTGIFNVGIHLVPAVNFFYRFKKNATLSSCSHPSNTPDMRVQPSIGNDVL